MLNNIKTPRCYKVSRLGDFDNINVLTGDIVYLRNNPFIYMKLDNDWDLYEKIYYEKDHPKYNLDSKFLEGQYVFVINNGTVLNSVPAKIGDLIYRSGDQFMYKKELNGIDVSYTKIYKY